MSTYRDQPLTPHAVVLETARIKKAFPSLPAGFYDILIERLKDKGFTVQRTSDAVKNVIDNCTYPTPTIADFISWDRKVKVFTYDQMIKKSDDAGMGTKFWHNYKSFQFKDLAVRVWIHVNDVKQYNITDNY